MANKISRKILLKKEIRARQMEGLNSGRPVRKKPGHAHPEHAEKKSILPLQTHSSEGRHGPI